MASSLPSRSSLCRRGCYGKTSIVDNYLQDRGDYRVYRVTKRKLTSPEAARVLAAQGAQLLVNSLNSRGPEETHHSFRRLVLGCIDADLGK